MVDSEDVAATSRAPVPLSSSRKMFWRSASWSASRTAAHNPEGEEKDLLDPNAAAGNSNGQSHRRFPVPLTPRSQQSSKARSGLPPLQLPIARRSLDEWPKAGSDDIGEWPQPPTPSGRGGGERLKLDLSTIQNNPAKNGGLVRRDKIAFFDKECSKVAQHIYLGGDAVAKDRDILKQNGITHVLNCVGFVCPEYFKADFVYRTLWLQDSPTEDITSILYDVFDYFEDVREQGGRVFVHCCQGVSRSTSLVIAYLMWREGQSFDDAFQYVKAARGIADPNMGFACQLLQCQKRVNAFPLSPSSLLRIYRIAPHSPYDPLHLVPKMLNSPSPSALDSRGAFIVHIPSAIYLWIGRNCELIMERDARGAVCQIVRYERVQGPITVIKEGEEPAYFWDAFSSLLPLMEKSVNGVEVGESKDKIRPGERKSDSYNIDFEIFQKAIMGGFVPPFASSENEHETHLPARESSWSALRRKFASGNMKEFVSAPRLSLTRVYSDSMMFLQSAKSSISPSSAHSSSSSSSSFSPPYLSPDSISSDSSTSSKYFSESSLDSPCAGSRSLPVSSTLTNCSDLSLHSCRSSNRPMSNSPEKVVSNLSSQASSRSTPIPSKKLSSSLAERRGSLSKSLKLPMMSLNTSSKSIPSEEDGVGITDSASSVHGKNNVGNVLESMVGVESGWDGSTPQCNIVLGKADSIDSCQREDSLIKHSPEPWRNSLPGEAAESSASNKMGASCTVRSNSMQPFVCCWPSLEKMATFGVSELDSKAVFAIFSPNRDSSKSEGMILYLWVGRFFDNGNNQIQLESDKTRSDKEDIDWHQVGSDVLIQTGLPKDTIIKIVKENEEPVEFFALLSPL
ncbi:protein-tyrosine-phosphatase MKP1 [Argentina anserina]|uniref:protein-tyrosine-phosphatase MKP1 n=1 Tax=Argentina anserina TaxID=57926 RepID=UPI0021765D7A|nr:protein-tyrosine-phosphatase MKP1 [Potentilla anserina]XP_050384914.1 protein-tyrosine-phosphatase MKP1 [Potentilla anserina]